MFILTGCREEAEQKTPNVVHLVVQPVHLVSMVPSIRTAGKLTSKVEFRLSFKTGGIINEIFIREGEKVEKGELLAQLELSEINSRVEQARLAVNKAERDFQRAKNLFQDSVVTLELFQNATTVLEVARSDLKISEFNLQHSRIIAPVNGLVLGKLAEENEIVGPGQPVLYFASTENEWVMRVNVTDKDRIHLSREDSAVVYFDAFPDRELRAKIAEIAEVADPFTGTYEIELTIHEKIPAPVSGLIGSALIYPARKIEFPLIPYEALMEGNGMTGQIWVLRNGKPEMINVTIFGLFDQGLFIEKGILPGDTVVIEGGQYIREDSRLVVNPGEIK
ncbi:MAG: efflux RND transporter periplasmic adaptor subunit [Cyclobacteriaceae bacterium]|nr:efflux RND transporter periplasmic adaptor subunit [Cyclobacteriaceae bacterium]